jgi:hypothetical protein
MISQYDVRRMDRWTQRVRKQTRRDMHRLQMHRQREATQRTVPSEAPMYTVLGWLRVAHAWWNGVAIPGIEHAVAGLFPPPARSVDRLLPDATVRRH